MLYNKAYITQDDVERAKTELLYHIACTKQSGAELVCCFFKIENDKMLSKINSECLKCLKSMKQNKRISLYITSDSFSLETLETEYLFNKHPVLKSDENLNNPSTPYIRIRL